MLRAAYVFLLAVLLTVGGCSSPSEVEEPEQALIANGYLAPGRDPEVLLRQTIAPERFYDGLEDTVRQAQVEIGVDGQTFVLSEAPEQPGTYRLPSNVLPIESGKTYHLRASHTGRQAHASTTVPFAPRITAATDTITYDQSYGDLYGSLQHPGEFSWTRSANAAGYVIIVEAVDVGTLPLSAEPLTTDLDTLIARRERLQGQLSPDSLAALDRRIQELQDYFARNVSLVGADGDTVRWLRDREQKDWEEIEGKKWTEGRKWRQRREQLYWSRQFEYWMPADSLRSDYLWIGVRFEGEYRVRLQAADRNYFDYAATYHNGNSGSDSDKGPLFHVEGGTGVFGSYAEETVRVWVRRGENGPVFKTVRQQ